MKKIIMLMLSCVLLTSCVSTTVVGIDKTNLSPKFNKSLVNRVAVIGFGKNVDVVYDSSIVADKFTAELVNSELFGIMDRNDIDKVMNEVGFQQKSYEVGILDDATRQKLRAIGADSILTGKLITYKQADRGANVLYAEVHLVAKLLRIETGEVLWSAEIQEKSKATEDKDAKSAEQLLSDIISKMCIPLKTDNKYKILLQKAI